MKIYAVGGSVRDALLGLPVADRDYVVVGATPEAMQRLGYRPVGRDFPVFLHPDTHEEYALARTERKSAPGYAGFVFHTDPAVTLEEDLARRDLTINAMAQDDDGRIIDPFGGQADLARRVLRHVGAAFVEDPVRVLRLARFAARYVDFSVAPETEALLASMVQAGEVDALVPERVWREFAVGLMEARPSRMLALLASCGALQRLVPELAGALHNPWRALDLAASRQRPLAVRVAVWLAEAGLDPGGARAAAQRLRMPAAPAELAQLVIAERPLIGAGQAAAPEVLVRLFERSDALRRPERFALALEALDDLAAAAQAPFARNTLEDALQRVRSVDAGAIARTVAPGAIAEAVHAARVAALVAQGS